MRFSILQIVFKFVYLQHKVYTGNFALILEEGNYKYKTRKNNHKYHCQFKKKPSNLIELKPNRCLYNSIISETMIPKEKSFRSAELFSFFVL